PHRLLARSEKKKARASKIVIGIFTFARKMHPSLQAKPRRIVLAPEREMRIHLSAQPDEMGRRFLRMAPGQKSGELAGHLHEEVRSLPVFDAAASDDDLRVGWNAERRERIARECLGSVVAHAVVHATTHDAGLGRFDGKKRI